MRRQAHRYDPDHLVVSINKGSFCGCPYNESPTIWGPDFWKLLLERGYMHGLASGLASLLELRESRLHKIDQSCRE